MGWPDFGTPQEYDSLLTVLEETDVFEGVPIVHCSAGVGRAMTALSCLITLRKLKACLSLAARSDGGGGSSGGGSSGGGSSGGGGGTVDLHNDMSKAPWWERHGCLHDPLDIPGTVTRLRQQRHGAVVNHGQYEMIFRFVLCISDVLGTCP